MTDDDPDRRPWEGPRFSSPDLAWLRPNLAKAGERCPACGYVFTGGEPFCGRMCEVHDPAVRWQIVMLTADLDVRTSTVMGYRMHRSDGSPFTDAENALADSETRSERAVSSALDAARGPAGARPWPKP